jgi:spore cortex formation protein SpoVR/YcgB (stage V sporulation)
VLRHLTTLWGYDVVLEEIDATTNEVLKAHMASPEP